MKKNYSTKIIASFMVLFVLSVFGAVQLVQSFSGATKYNIEVWNGDIVESGELVQGELGGITFEREEFPTGANITVYGGNLTAYTSGSVTFTAADICDSKVITQDNIGAAASAQTNTFPTAASLRLRCFENNGDSRTVRFENLAGSGEPFTFATGTGIDVFIASGSVGDGLVLPPEGAAQVTFTRINGTSISLDFIELINAD